MANQYIGARYVPKFSGQWVATDIYEPLTVVDYGNVSYISKLVVPANTLPTNTNYWKPYIIPSPGLDNITQEVESLSSNVSSLQTAVDNLESQSGASFKGANVLWVTDSWGQIWGSLTMVHPNIVATSLKFGQLFLDAVSGSGYATGETYLTRIQAFKTTHANEKIDYIIIEGSINDRNSIGENLKNAVSSTISTAQNLFPDAQIIIIPNLFPSSLNSDVYNFVGTNKDVYKTALKNNVWLINIPTLLLGQSSMMEDSTHPNDNGQKMIAQCLIQNLMGQKFPMPDLQPMSVTGWFVSGNGQDIILATSPSSNIPTSLTIPDLKGFTSTEINCVMQAFNSTTHDIASIFLISSTPFTLNAKLPSGMSTGILYKQLTYM